ncbi:MAG: hypothetical protein IPG59_17860 [Candidatus Melainabacteria bacterium]|nr:MAG: hypothetical protein IPG59_17860 [Candidatus Melainabacteria bacterium]
MEHKVFSRKKQYSQFSTEHVLHEAFGGFKNALTLNGEVCKICNSYFGDTMDRILTRGTYEAVERFRTGAKSLLEFEDFVEQNIKFFTKNKQPVLNDAPAKLCVVDNQLKIAFVPHIAFEQKHKMEWIRFNEQELLNSTLPDSDQLTGNWQILANTADEEEKIFSLVNAKGRNITPTGTAIPGIVPVYAEYRIDDLVKRALAKICFNYLADIMVEKKYPEFLFNKYLDAAREFIRCGIWAEHEIVEPKTEPILGLDTKSLRQTNGHLVSVELIEEHGKWKIQGSVSLYNTFDWKVNLANHFHGIQIPINRGHHWNISSLNCSSMKSVQRDLTVNVWQ